MLKKVKKCGVVFVAMLILAFSPMILAEAIGQPPTSISALGTTNRTMIVGHDMDLEVRMTPRQADEHSLSWKIVSGSQCVRFDDYDTYDDEVEIRALKAGTAKVQCSIVGNPSQKVTFNITVKNTAFKASGAKKKTISAGDSVDLAVVSDARDHNLKWSIAAKYKNIVAFEDDDRYGDDIEVIGLKAGTAKVVCKNTLTKEKITFTVVVKKGNGATITRKGSSSKKVGLGDDVELEVKKKAGTSDANLKWSIADTSVLRFDENDNIGDEVDVVGLKLGQTTVTCNNQMTGEKISFQVQVVRYYDDDYDD